MTETAFLPTLAFLAVIYLATWSCLTVSHALTWRSEKAFDLVRIMFASGCAPFLTGLACVVVLTALPGAEHWMHGCIIILLVALPGIVVWALGVRPASFNGRRFSPHSRFSAIEKLFVVLIALWWLALLLNVLVFPLTQNDALEYMLVGRELFASRSISTYPVLNSTDNITGFYGPWTHPPLYVAMIYGANVLQGHADLPGISKLIAPWFLTANVALIYSLGRLWSRFAALLAALMLISTPLYYLGAGSALLDAQPLLGVTLVFAAIVGVRGTSAQRGIAVGIALGFALWSHSQAILLVPLTIAALAAWVGIKSRRKVLVQSAMTGIFAGIVSVWPYLRNIAIFGSPVSDNPTVFRVPSLGWADYFRIARGIETTPDLIQYGVFKGWFALEAYSISFWLMSAGVIFFIASRSWNVLSSALTNASEAQLLDRVFITALTFLFFYQVGLTLSVFLGIDLLIRNERYLLMIMPLVIIVAVGGLSSLWQQYVQRVDHHVSLRGYRWFAVGIIGFSILMVVQFLAIAAYRVGVAAMYPAKWQKSPLEKLADVSSLNPVLATRCIAQDALVLSMKPADMFYSSRKMVSYMDPMLLPFYALKDVRAAHSELLRLGIRYVQVPDYNLPPFDRSALAAILMQPELSSLISADGNNQLYALHQRGDPAKVYEFKSVPLDTAWTRKRQLVFGGRKALARFTIGSDIYNEGEASKGPQMPFFRRETAIVLTSSHSGKQLSRGHAEFSPVRTERTYFLNLKLSGFAHALIHLQTRDADGRISSILLGDTILSRGNQQLSFLRQFVLPDDATALRVAVEHRGSGSIIIHQAELKYLASKPPARIKLSDACHSNDRSVSSD